MLNNNTTSYTVYARAVTINYPYMTIFTFHNLGGESFILFTNQIISLCTSKHFFSLSLSLFFFSLSVLALLAFVQLSNFLFFSWICYISLPLPLFCSSYNKNQTTRWEEHFHFAPKTISSPCWWLFVALCSVLFTSPPHLGWKSEISGTITNLQCSCTLSQVNIYLIAMDCNTLWICFLPDLSQYFLGGKMNLWYMCVTTWLLSSS